MARIACIVVGTATATVMATAAGNAIAAPRQVQRHASSTPHHTQSRPATVSNSPVRATVVYPIFASYAPAHRPASYASSRQPLTFSRSATPSVYFVPAISPNAPPFSFSESVEQPGWNWQRVSLQQIDAEVRARRAGKEPGAAPAYRQYCPDSRAYYPDVIQCASEWLKVVGKASMQGGIQ